MSNTITWTNSSWFNNPYLIGFENVFPKFDQVIKSNEGTFPPYNVRKIDDNAFVIELAVAGFSQKDLTITEQDGNLTIVGEKAESEAEYLYKGIAARKFTRTYALSEYVRTVGAELKDGILFVTLKKDFPEEKKPRSISIIAEQPKKISQKEKNLNGWHREKEYYNKSVN
jgi:molecular chaperone IbpA